MASDENNTGTTIAITFGGIALVGALGFGAKMMMDASAQREAILRSELAAAQRAPALPTPLPANPSTAQKVGSVLEGVLGGLGGIGGIINLFSGRR